MPLITVQQKIRDGFDPNFLCSLARMVIEFGRLEYVVKLAIKNLAVSLKISADFTEGMIEAELKRQFGSMCDYMLKLHETRFAICSDGDELKRWIDWAKKLADARGKIVHASLTIDDQGVPLALYTKVRKSQRRIEFTEVTVTTDAIDGLREQIHKARLGLDAVRRTWT